MKLPAYEALFIFKPDLKEEETNTLIQNLENLLKENKASIDVSQVYGKRQLTYEIKKFKDLAEASTRISNLVTSIKSHVHMDRTNEKQPTDIHKDIENTLTLLGYKIRDKNITLKKSFCEDLPEIPAHVGELNQVWTNIIDNAIYAVSRDGKIDIETRCDEKNVNVWIIDNGSGIPSDIQTRIFDPFFTTKKVGEGTGIGLDIVQRIIKSHEGEIKVHSIPGRTEFHICLPIK